MTYNIETLKEQVKKVLEHSSELECQVDTLLNRWAEAKRKLLQDFGGRLIIESPTYITIEKPEEDKQIEFEDYVDEIGFQTANEELRAFLIDQGYEAFYNNSVAETWNRFGIKVPKGMRMTRALKLFIKKKKELDYWQTLYSRILQEVRGHGRLCLSIHPLDYLSISENSHNWRTCQSLDGEYRAGNLSYMIDEVTVVAYLKSDGDHKLPNFPLDVPWNSKKWRMLFYVNADRDVLFASKPYPFEAPLLKERAFGAIEEVFPNTWPEESSSVGHKAIKAYLRDAMGAVQFNDCLTSASYVAKYKCAKGNDKLAECGVIEVGSEVPCLQCGQGYIEFGADYRCIECGDYLECENCGSHMYGDEAYYLDKQDVCPGCYDDLVVWCNACGKTHNRENPEIIYDKFSDVYYCPRCVEEIDIVEWEEVEEEEENGSVG